MQLNCVNCDKLIFKPIPASLLFCSQLCNQEAHFVRYARSVTKDGRITRDDIQAALKIRRAWILSGGYPESERTVREEIRIFVFKREAGVCVLCGRPATEIDHHTVDLNVPINDPVNLRALCTDCHREKTLSNIRPIDAETEPELVSKSMELDARIDAPIPLRVSDDEANWKNKWRTIETQRKSLIRAETPAAGLPSAEAK